MKIAPYWAAPWDVAWIGGRRVPGRCEVKAISSATKRHPARINVRCAIYTVGQWRLLRKLISAVAPGKSGRPRRLAVYHPFTQMIGVQRVVVEAVGRPKRGYRDGPGTKTVTFRCAVAPGRAA